MANIKSAKKRVKIASKKTLINKMFMSSMKSSIKKYEKALADGDKELAMATYKAAVKKIDQAVAKGHIHPNKAARKKSQFTRKINAINA